YDGGGVSASGLSDSATRVGGDPGPRAGEGVWARAYGARDEGGNVFNEEKIGLIAGADAAVSEAVRLGLAVNYAHNTARFIDAAKTNVESYQAMGYGSWEGGPWYASGLASVGLNSFDTTRNLASFGLAGTATSHPRGESWSGYGEAGYHVMGVPWAHLTPYAGLGYVGTHLDGFSESGGLGALQVNAATGSSLESQLGVRVSTRIGGLVPELRAAWGHEFLDAAPTITGTLETVPGSGFSAAGANFGRDSALIGAGVTHEVSETVRIFVDYDGRLTVGFSEHVVSAGVRVRF
ncbi:MAG TPA: autotransporter outer membrane beta-barrel domain-containing protein, partial [Stellaceae bacterium]|nr:autotransporter outer membrane beta-barrel domain-containing protein [Stellaceae bacterium]